MCDGRFLTPLLLQPLGVSVGQIKPQPVSVKFCWNPPSRNACLLPPGCSAEDSLEAVTEAVHPTKLKILTATLYGKRLLTSALEQNKG